MKLQKRLSKLESNRPEPEPKPSIDLSRLSDETLAELAAQADQAKLDLSKFSITALKEMRDVYD